MSELLSCAHCGGTKNRIVTKRAKTGYYGGGSPAYYMMAYVTCGKCHARGPVASAERIPSSFTADVNAEIESLKERAAELWNRRVPVVRGEWITTETYSSMYRTNLSETTCSACGKRPNIYMLKSDYCPNCGAKMEDKPCE